MGIYEHYSDEEIMALVKGGETDAFEEIYDRYEKRVYNFVLRMVPTTQEAEDVTMEVFLRAFEAAPRYTPQAKLKTWLYRIAFNLCATAAKRRKPLISLDKPLRSQEDSEEDLEWQVPDEHSDPAEEAEKTELREAIQKALQSLPVDQRTAMTLLVYDDFSYEEIAEAMKCTVMAVKAKIHRARLHLRSLLKPFLPESSEGAQEDFL